MSELQKKAEAWIQHVLDSQCDVNYKISFEAGYRAALEDVKKQAELIMSKEWVEFLEEIISDLESQE